MIRDAVRFEMAMPSSRASPERKGGAGFVDFPFTGNPTPDDGALLLHMARLIPSQRAVGYKRRRPLWPGHRCHQRVRLPRRLVAAGGFVPSRALPPPLQGP